MTHRVAVIFDCLQRPETTGVYCLRALGELCHAHYVAPSDVASLAEPFDLYLWIDDGIRHDVPSHLHPSAWWVIDTHMESEWRVEQARAFDFVFAAQQDAVARLSSAGITNVKWLPLACDPTVHRQHTVENAFDVCFVGNVNSAGRRHFLGKVAEHFPKTFVGNAYFADMARSYSAAHLGINCCIDDDINMRAFEVMSCGTMLVTNDLSHKGQEQLFRNGVHCATFTECSEMIDTLGYYLKHPDERQRIAAAGMDHVHKHHTYSQRMRQILDVALGGDVDATRGNVDPSPATGESTPRFSACILNWQRPDNLPRIVAQIRSCPYIDDIVIWNNNPDAELAVEDSNTSVISSEWNVKVYGRFLAAQHAKHEFIYTQDDDCIVRNVDQICESFLARPEQLTHSLRLEHLLRTNERVFDVGEVALLGWGAAFKRSWTSVLSEYTDSFGRDELLHREADRLFTLLLRRRHQTLLADFEELDGASSAEALSAHTEHRKHVLSALERGLQLISASTRGEATDAPRQDGQGIVEGEGRSPVVAVDYYSFPRPEVAQMIPRTASRILEVGCGAGALGESVKQRQACHYVGIERNSRAARAARKKLDRVECADFNSVVRRLDPGFDCVVFADVLEHLDSPEAALKTACSLLRPSGRLVASLPNVQHVSVVSSLLDGNWTYEPAGLLDTTHQRFFTRRDALEMLDACGYDVVAMSRVKGSGFDEWIAAGRPRQIRLGGLTIDCRDEDAAADFFTYQILVVAKPRSSVQDSKTADPKKTRRFCIKDGYRERLAPLSSNTSVADDVVYQPEVYALAATLASSSCASHLVDIGCGARGTAIRFSDSKTKVVGCDKDVVINECRERWPEHVWHACDFESHQSLKALDVPWKESVIVCADVLEHLVDPTSLLEELARLASLAPLLLISTPERDIVRGSDHWGPPPNRSHAREWNAGEFSDLLARFGFNVVYSGLTINNERDRECSTILSVVAGVSSQTPNSSVSTENENVAG